MLGDDEIKDEQAEQAVADLLTTHYRPARDAGEATEMLTTEQLWAWVEEHLPERMQRSGLRGLLLRLEFRDLSLHGTLYWLLRAA